jgi:hypothetical protein
MYSNISLKNVSLTLYAFHLLKDADTDRREDANLLWENIAKLSQPFNLSNLKEFPQKIIDKSHLDSAFLNLLPCVYEEYKIDELFFKVIPFRLHDTYAVDFTVFIKNKAISIHELSQLNPQDCLLPQHINASRGQTLLLYAEVESEAEINKNLAKECIKNLWENDCPDFIIKQGRLFGSPLFECEEITNNPTKETTHILVWFGTDSQTSTLASEKNRFLIKLLCQRHKILLSYSDAQQDYKNARELRRQLDSKSDQFSKLLKNHSKKQLDEWKELLLIMVDYTRCLRSLNDHRITVFANRENYGKSLNFFREFQLPNDNIDFWQTFYDEKSKLSHQQIEINLAYLEPAQPQFQQLIDSIQGLTQIETLKHEFDKQERIELLVVFIATTLESAAISAKVDFHHHLPDLFKGLVGDINSVLGQHFINIFTHLGVGFVFGLFALSILWLYRQIIHHRKTQ